MESLTPAQQELYDWLVEYIHKTQDTPSIEQMMVAMNLHSPAPIQSRLEKLRNKGYIDWIDGKAHTLEILHPPDKKSEKTSIKKVREALTPAQQELYDWLVEYVHITQDAPSIKQMMVAMNLRSPAPIQSRLERLRNKGYIDWSDGKARTLKILHPRNQRHSSNQQVVLGINVEQDDSLTESIALELAILCKAMNAYHIACGGSGLVIDEWKTFVSKLELVEV